MGQRISILLALPGPGFPTSIREPGNEESPEDCGLSVFFFDKINMATGVIGDPKELNLVKTPRKETPVIVVPKVKG